MRIALAPRKSLDILKTFSPLFYCLFLLISIDSRASASEGIYRRYFPDKVITLDPLVSAERYSQHVILQIYDPLFKAKHGLTPEPRLATSYKYDPNTRTYDISLRNDVYFSNGSRFTAEDVIFTLKRSCEKEGKLKVPPVIRGCRTNEPFGAVKVDDFLLKITLREPYPPFIALLSSPHLLMLPNNFAGKTPEEFFKNPVTTGPFQVEQLGEKKITLIRNEKYFLGVPNIKRMELIIDSPENIYQKLKSGEIDDIYPLPAPEKFSDRYEEVSYNTASTIFIGFQPKIAPFQDENVRKAIRASIDNYALKPLLKKQTGVYLAKGVVPWGALGFDESIKDNYFNPLQVKEFLAKSTYHKRSLPKLSLHTVIKKPFSPDLPQAVVSMLKSSGFDVELKEQSLPELMKDIRENKVGMMLISPTMSSTDTYQYLELWHSSFQNPALNLGDKEVDALLDQAIQSDDRLVRARIYKTLNRLIADRAYTHNIAYITQHHSLRAKGWEFPKLDLLGPFFLTMYDVKRKN